jgi:hypothetical protein
MPEFAVSQVAAVRFFIMSTLKNASAAGAKLSPST